MNRLKKAAAAFISAAALTSAIACCSVGVCAESQYKIYDDAYLLSDEECAAVEEQLGDISYNYDTDIVVFTIQSLEGDTVESWSEYLNSEYGTGMGNGGISLLVAMDEREWDIYAFGTAKAEVFIPDVRENIGSSVKSYLSGGDYYSAFTTFGELCAEQLAYVEENGPNTADSYAGKKSIAVPVGIGAGLIIALIAVLIMKSSLNTAVPESRADNYIRKGSMKLNRSIDLFLYSTIEKTEKKSDDDSSSDTSNGHTSGSF
ncbi:MAG: TPM domain-containing protein [Huintestinicola sp.]